MVRVLDFTCIRWSWFKIIVLSYQAVHSQFLSPPRCINGSDQFSMGQQRVTLRWTHWESHLEWSRNTHPIETVEKHQPDATLGSHADLTFFRRILNKFSLLSRAARVEQSSVNSVTLNDQPQDPHQRFLVAANIGINATGSAMIAR